MSNNLEIVMDIDTLEIFEVIDLDEEKEVIVTDDDLNRVWLGNGYYYKPSSLLWRNEREDVIHELRPKNKHGSYPYYQRCRNYIRGHVSQLTYEEALWLTLEFYPELMNYI